MYSPYGTVSPLAALGGGTGLPPEVLAQLLGALGIAPPRALSPQVVINDNGINQLDDKLVNRMMNLNTRTAPSVTSNPNDWVNDYFFLGGRPAAQAEGVVGPRANDGRRK